VSGDFCTVVLDQTPFYAEAGGQAGDRGLIRCGSSVFKVENTIARGGYVFHAGRLTGGNMKNGDVVEAIVDEKWRTGCMQHHTATHLVMAAVERLFGSVRQRSSKLDSQIAELGFWTSAPLTADMVIQLERDVNEIIQRDAPIYVEEADFEKAKKISTLRWMTGEQYPDVVRIVSAGLRPNDCWNWPTKGLVV